MLQCTPAAAATLESVRAQQGLPETSGLRLFPAGLDDGRLTLGIGFAEAPEQGDQVTESHGARLFVAPEIAGELDGLALDAAPEPSANGDQPSQLILRPQGETQ